MHIDMIRTENQQQTFILKAYYYLEVHNAHFRLASYAESEITLLIGPVLPH